MARIPWPFGKDSEESSGNMEKEMLNPLKVHELRRRSDPQRFAFRTTDELQPIEGLIGQERALEAVQFGTRISSPGYNLFALGSSGSGRHTAIRKLVEETAASAPAPDDWVYVNNFADSHKPKALRLPPGIALHFRDAMQELIEDLRTAIPATFESDEYRNQRRAIDQSLEDGHESAFDDLRTRAEAEHIGILRTPMGYALAPMQDGNVIKPDIFNELPLEQRQIIESKIAELQKELEEVLRRLPLIQKEHRAKLRALNTEVAKLTVDVSIAEISAKFSDVDTIQTYLAEAKTDLITNAGIFLESEQAEDGGAFPAAALNPLDPKFRRYSVNVIVGSPELAEDAGRRRLGAPVVFEELPTYANLLGRIEHISQLGALVTDFTLIKPGALHRANGGFLILDAARVLTEPLSWEALKRSLRGGYIKITSAGEQLSLVSTISLEPDPIPLTVKVVLIGERMLYYLLVSQDPDFRDLFKVEADFDEVVERTDDNTDLYARLIANIAKREGLKPLSREAVGAVMDESARLADDAERLSLRIGKLADLLREAHFWAGDAGHQVIEAENVAQAVRKKTYRADRIREKSLESINRDIVLIDSTGEAVGQINGLSVISFGDFSFGRPTRITARVRMGTGKVVDIEREVELGGPLHSKGVLILSSLLATRYALGEPMSLWASLVFEQSYGGIDGDSASSAELYALLSALADVPIKQSFAVTGSVNQFGEVQAIGGINEKIEGFFDVCRLRGLTGDQGILMPASNAKHLMLREDIVEAARNEQFKIYAVETIDQGIEVLTAMPAGERGPDGEFPPDSINAKVEAKLRAFARARRAYGGRDGDDREAEAPESS